MKSLFSCGTEEKIVKSVHTFSMISMIHSPYCLSGGWYPVNPLPLNNGGLSWVEAVSPCLWGVRTHEPGYSRNSKKKRKVPNNLAYAIEMKRIMSVFHPLKGSLSSVRICETFFCPLDFVVQELYGPLWCHVVLWCSWQILLLCFVLPRVLVLRLRRLAPMEHLHTHV